MTMDEFKQRLEVANAFARGEECEVRMDLVDTGWQRLVLYDGTGGDVYMQRALFDEFFAVRIKPEPKLVPWESIEEVPINDWFMGNYACGKVWQRLVWVAEKGVGIAHNTIEYAELFTNWKHTPDPKTGNWFPCGKEVVV